MNALLSSPVANALALTLTHFLWQGLLIAACYWILHEVLHMHSRSAQVRYTTALGALLLLAVCPLVTVLAIYNPQSTVVSETAPLQVEQTPQSNTETVAVETVLPPEKAVFTGAGGTGIESVLSDSRPYILLLWLAGVMLSGTRLLAGFTNIVWLRWGRKELLTGELAGRSRQIARNLKLKTARVFTSRHIREAAVVGFWQPVVLLPASWITALPTDVLEAVIAHELAHIRRHDVWINLLQRIVETLLFYHPVVWWLSNRVRLEREMCCDELAIEATHNRRSYVVALEQVGRLQFHGNLNLATSFTGDRKMTLLRRVRNVLQMNGKPEREPAWVVGLVAVLLPLLVLAINSVPGTENSVMAQEREGGRSAEAEAGPRRSAEAEAGPRRSAEGRQAGQAQEALKGFRPQTPREAALFQMILQLQKQVDELRREVRSENGKMRDGRGEEGFRGKEGDAAVSVEQFELPANWKRTKEGRVFMAYDKNGDEIVSLEEWLAMTNGLSSPARRKISTKHFNDAEPSGDGKFTPAEFIWYRKGGRVQAKGRDRQARARDGEGEGARRGPRDGEGERKGPRDGEGGAKRGPRDGEGVKRGPRDGEGAEKRGPRDGERAKEGPRDGDAPREGE
ncbi:M56 family metallopeptidase [Gimesia panareensis]|uniref:M56 family metallopeptidase n=1 Tax=Gimesia panareensis TaxID=2527978 RepID=UPI00118C677D|nr:M56 family metallopeptidase [Gimesia panareensis]QDU49588.1 Regulatory protein BlaR1 [Gimesia panareensis]